MPKRVKAWYDRRWLLPTIAIFTLISAPFREDIRKAVPAGVGVMLEDWFFDFLLTGGMLGLAVVLILKSDRATRACEDLRQQLQKDLADHRKQLSADLAGNREQLQEDLSALVASNGATGRCPADSAATEESPSQRLCRAVRPLDQRGVSQSRGPAWRGSCTPARPRVRRTFPSREKPSGPRQPTPAATATSGQPGRRR